MKLRQIVLCAADFDAVVEDIQAVLGLQISHRDPAVAAFGLQNAVFPVGSTFLEVVSPIREQTAAGRFLQRRGGDGGYMIMLQTDDFARARARIHAVGAQVVFSVDLDDISEVHVHPRDLSGAIVSVSQPRPAESWRWAGPDWETKRHLNVVDAVTGVLFESTAPTAVARRYAEVLGLGEPSSEGRIASIGLKGARLGFAPLGDLSRDGIVAYELRARDPRRALEAAETRGLATERSSQEAAVKIAGTWLRLHR